LRGAKLSEREHDPSHISEVAHFGNPEAN
jgi:hypothetical protein